MVHVRLCCPPNLWCSLSRSHGHTGGLAFCGASYNIQDFAGAVEDFTAAIHLDPNSADFFHNRGFALRKQVRLAWDVCCLYPLVADILYI